MNNNIKKIVVKDMTTITAIMKSSKKNLNLKLN